MKSKFLTSDLLEQYRRDGFFIVRSLFDDQEMQLLRQATQIDKSLHEGAHQARDGEGGTIKLSLWNEAKDDIYGLFVSADGQNQPGRVE